MQLGCLMFVNVPHYLEYLLLQTTVPKKFTGLFFLFLAAIAMRIEL